MPETRVIISRRRLLASLAAAGGTAIAPRRARAAKIVLKVPKVITRIYDPIREETYQTLGLETICPTVLGAQLIQGILAQCQADGS